MSSTAIDQQHHFTYGDYMTWPEDERWELIDGTAYNMTPSPTSVHQEIVLELGTQIRTYLRGKKCRAYPAPFDVRLPDDNEADEHISSVVQPDITVVCDLQKVSLAGCRGAPDFIIEIISPSTATKDQVQKTALYEKHGVKEYWIVHPQDGLLTIRVMGADGVYQRPRIMEFTGSVDVESVEGLTIDLNLIGELRDEAFPKPENKPSPLQNNS